MDLWRYEMKLGFAAANPRSHAVIKDLGGRRDLEEAVDALAEGDPDGYANLAEHLPLEEYRGRGGLSRE